MSGPENHLEVQDVADRILRKRRWTLSLECVEVADAGLQDGKNRPQKAESGPSEPALGWVPLALGVLGIVATVLVGLWL